MNNFLEFHYNELKNIFSDPDIELRNLLKNTSIKNKEIIISNFQQEDINIKKFQEAFKRRINREPISKIFNKKSFWKYDFFVNDKVLDPRPETEIIIEKILEYFKNKKQPLKILDICTGSGCLAISIAKEYPNSIITATDISPEAINVAKINSNKLNCNNQIEFIECDVINKIETYDIILSNPPYLSEEEYKNTSKEIQYFEPKIALIAGKRGLDFFEKISRISNKILTEDSICFLEIGNSQAVSVVNLFDNNHINCLEIVKDLQNLNRVLVLKKS